MAVSERQRVSVRVGGDVYNMSVCGGVVGMCIAGACECAGRGGCV